MGFLLRASAEKSTIGVGATVGFLHALQVTISLSGHCSDMRFRACFLRGSFLQATGWIITRIPLAVERRTKVRHGTALLGNALEPRRLLKSSTPGPARLWAAPPGIPASRLR